jgi:cytochrome P450
MSIPSVSLPSVEVDPAALFADPYPTYERLRREAPVAYAPALDRYLVSRYQDIVTVSRDWETFSAEEDTPAPENAVVGETLMARDGDEHARLRRMMAAPLRQSSIREHWQPVFRANTDALLAELADRGEADLFADFATPLAATNLASFLGFIDVSAEELIGWCKGIISSADNYLNDPEVAARGYAARAGVIGAVDTAIERLQGHPDPSMISSMINADEPMTAEQIYNNIMISIGGGLNEPRDVLLTATYGLLTNPDQLVDVQRDRSLWRNAFEEACRWVAPIGMFIREVHRPVELGGVQLTTGDGIAAIIASGNRDERVYENADAFDLHRKASVHLAFGGGGPHYCIGAWASRSSVADITLPAMFDRLTNLRLDGEVTWGGFVFRGPLTMPVRWDAS